MIWGSYYDDEFHSAVYGDGLVYFSGVGCYFHNFACGGLHRGESSPTAGV